MYSVDVSHPTSQFPPSRITSVTNPLTAPDYFVDPLSFIPERWSTKPELVKQKDAYAPFSTGPYNCIGKNLALMEVRTITSQIVDQFDVSFAPGEDGSTLLMKTRDHFTLGLAELRLCFWRRA